jgi:hypothetical protein
MIFVAPPAALHTEDRRPHPGECESAESAPLLLRSDGEAVAAPLDGLDQRSA